jgi:hypothetical protein
MYLGDPPPDHAIHVKDRDFFDGMTSQAAQLKKGGVHRHPPASSCLDHFSSRRCGSRQVMRACLLAM